MAAGLFVRQLSFTQCELRSVAAGLFNRQLLSIQCEMLSVAAGLFVPQLSFIQCEMRSVAAGLVNRQLSFTQCELWQRGLRPLCFPARALTDFFKKMASLLLLSSARLQAK